MRPHRRQPTRLPHPWDSPGKNTGVGCHFLLQGMKVKSEGEVTQSCPTASDPMDCSPPGSSIHGIFQARVLEWGATAFSANIALSCLIWQLFYIPLHFWQLLNSSLSHVIIFYHFICEDFKFSIRSIILFLHSFDLLISHSSYCLIILPLFLSCIYIFFLHSTL